MDLQSIRQDYSGPSTNNLPSEPHVAIERWLTEALETEIEATAFSLATHRDQEISVRVVLAKEVTKEGVVFYTNGQSQKGDNLAHTPRAAGVFFWPKLQRQIRFEGPVTRVSTSEADTYFGSRPRASQLAAIASQQSKKIDSYDLLLEKFQALEKDLAAIPVERPAHWGGYRIALEKVEFWQGQRSRLHERLIFEKKPDGSYAKYCLQP